MLNDNIVLRQWEGNTNWSIDILLTSLSGGIHQRYRRPSQRKYFDYLVLLAAASLMSLNVGLLVVIAPAQLQRCPVAVLLVLPAFEGCFLAFASLTILANLATLE